MLGCVVLVVNLVVGGDGCGFGYDVGDWWSYDVGFYVWCDFDF